MKSNFYCLLLKLHLIFVYLLVAACPVFAQGSGLQKDLPLVVLSSGSTIHFLSPENIQYVDISSSALVGDLPVKNMLRLKLIVDSLKELRFQGGNLGVLTVVGESFIAQYNLAYNPLISPGYTHPMIEIIPEQTRPLDNSAMELSAAQLKNFAFRLLESRTNRSIRSSGAYGVSVKLNQLYSLGGYIFMDISYFNDTGLAYQIDQQRFKVEDNQINKATNVQSVEIKPIFQLFPGESFKKQYRNIYVIKKLTYPGNKVLNISLTEKQLSGRSLNLGIKYSDILNADTF